MRPVPKPPPIRRGGPGPRRSVGGSSRLPTSRAPPRLGALFPAGAPRMGREGPRYRSPRYRGGSRCAVASSLGANDAAFRIARMMTNALACVRDRHGGRERERERDGTMEGLRGTGRRRVLEPLSFPRAVQLLLQRVLLRLSHLSTLSVPCRTLIFFFFFFFCCPCCCSSRCSFCVSSRARIALQEISLSLYPATCVDHRIKGIFLAAER